MLISTGYWKCWSNVTGRKLSFIYEKKKKKQSGKEKMMLHFLLQNSCERNMKEKKVIENGTFSKDSSGQHVLL